MKTRHFLSVLLVSMWLLTLCACGGSSNTASETTADEDGDGAASASTEHEDYFEWDIYGSNENYISGLTEEGAKQTSLVIPERCEGFSGSVFYGDDIRVETVTFEGEHDVVLGAGFSSSSSLKTVVLPEGLTEVASQAFYGSSVESVTIPSTVTVIGSYAFQSCGNLREVVIQGTGLVEVGDAAFNYCTSLESINLPDSVTTIGKKAFERCSALTEIALPESLTTLGEGAFLTAGLTDIYMPEAMELEEYDVSTSLNTDADTTVHVASGSWASEQQSVWEEMGHTVSVE